ncbi:MAG: hypothetical protein WC460_02800 [Patescibacteria group bacterium]
MIVKVVIESCRPNVGEEIFIHCDEKRTDLEKIQQGLEDYLKNKYPGKLIKVATKGSSFSAIRDSDIRKKLSGFPGVTLIPEIHAHIRDPEAIK